MRLPLSRILSPSASSWFCCCLPQTSHLLGSYCKRTWVCAVMCRSSFADFISGPHSTQAAQNLESTRRFLWSPTQGLHNGRFSFGFPFENGKQHKMAARRRNSFGTSHAGSGFSHLSLRYWSAPGQPRATSGWWLR